MKTIYALFAAAFVLISSASFSQTQKSVFEGAGLIKSGDGLPCVQLAWKKGSEKAAYYLVERSTDGNAFKQIALVFTSEDESLTDYAFRDKNFSAAGSSAYYRITIVDEQKELTFLPAKKVDFSAAAISAALNETNSAATEKK